MADELVHLDVADGVATVTLDSPRNRNALSAQLRRELQAPPRRGGRRPGRPRGRPGPHRSGLLLRHGPAGVPRCGGRRAGGRGVPRDPAHDPGPRPSRWSRGSPARPGPGGSGCSRPATSRWPSTPPPSPSPRSASAWSPRSSPSPCSPGCSPGPPTSCSSPARRSTRARRGRRPRQRRRARRTARRRGGALRRAAPAGRAGRTGRDEGPDAASRTRFCVRGDAAALGTPLRLRRGPGGHGRLRREAPAELGGGAVIPGQAVAAPVSRMSSPASAKARAGRPVGSVRIRRSTPRARACSRTSRSRPIPALGR